MITTFYSTEQFEIPYLRGKNSENFKIKLVRDRLDKETASLSEGSEAIVIFINDQVTEEVLKILKENGVKFIATRSMGLDHIDIEKTKEMGFRIAHVPHYSPYAVAEHSVALMLALNRNLIIANQKIHAHDFRLNNLLGFDMNKKVVGIIGAGEIGAVSSKILHGLGCEILIYDIEENEELVEKYKVRYLDLDELCENSDIITIHAPLTDETKHLINLKRIEQMKDGVMLINVARGGICKTEDLIEGLKSGKIGYLGMDVYEHEKGLFSEDHSSGILQDDIIVRLMGFKNVIITAHQAYLTREALEDYMEITFNNLKAWADGKEAENEVKD
jgi:D-lactate dehydrogenase